MHVARRKIKELALRQHGLVTRSQATVTGLSRSGRRTMVDRGELELVGARTLRVSGAPESPRQRVLLACLDLDAVASHRTAAALHGLTGFGLDKLPEVVVSHGRQTVRSPLALVHTSTWLPTDDLVEVDGIPTLGLARTLISLAGAVPQIPLDTVRGAVDEAVRDGKASDPWLSWRLEQVRCRGRRGVSVFEEILTRRAGGEATESWLERELLRVLAAAGVPLPVCQRRIQHQGAFVGRVDFAYLDAGVIIEVTGHEHHSTAKERAADARRRNDLQLAGYRVIEFTYNDVVGDPAYVVAKVLDALVLARAS